jgi:hypothetical protein
LGFNLYLQMLRSLLVILCFVFGVFTLHAQAVFTGRVLENKTRITLNNIRVLNLNTKQTAVTGSDGQFVLNAKIGDRIIFKGYAYVTDTLLLIDLHFKEIFLEAVKNVLNQVTITDSSGRTSAAAKNMTYYDPQFHGQTAVGHRDMDGNFDGGAILRLHYFTKDARDKRKAEQKAEDRKISEQISKVFTPENINKYVPLKGEDLNNFILLYIPEVEVYTHKDFNLLTYLNACYKDWQTLTDEQKKAGQIFKK